MSDTKAIRIRLVDSEGKVYSWTIHSSPLAPRGWEFTDHEGYTRFSEGNWHNLVFHFKNVAENYGLSLLSELN